MSDEKVIIQLPWDVIAEVLLSAEAKDASYTVMETFVRPWACVLKSGGETNVRGFDSYDDCAKAVGQAHLNGVEVVAVLKDGTRRQKVKVETNVKVRL